MRSKNWYVLLVLLAGSSYGLISSIMKVAYAHGFHVQDVTNAQYGVAAVILWGMVFVRRSYQRITGRELLLLVVIGFAGAGTSISYYLSLTFLPASLAIVLLFQFSWIVMLMDIIVKRRIPTWEKWFGLALIISGTFIAVGLFGGQFTHYPIWALVLGLMSSFFYALTLYLSEYVNPQTSASYRSAIVVTVSGICIIPFFHPTYLWSGVLFHGLWFWGLLVALFSQVIPLVFLLVAIPKTGGRMAGVLGSVELPVAVFVASIWLNEYIPFGHWLGVTLIIIGIIVSEWTAFGFRRRKSLASNG